MHRGRVMYMFFNNPPPAAHYSRRKTKCGRETRTMGATTRSVSRN